MCGFIAFSCDVIKSVKLPVHNYFDPVRISSIFLFGDDMEEGKRHVIVVLVSHVCFFESYLYFNFKAP